MEFPSFLENSETVYLLKIDEKGNILSSNHHFNEMFSRSGDELIGKQLTEFIVRKDLPAFRQMLEDCIKAKKNGPVSELSLKNGTDTNIKIQWECSPGENGMKASGEIICIGCDILPRPDINQAEEKYHSLFEQASDPIMITDFKGNFIDVNTSMCTMFGYQKDELLKMNISALIEPVSLKQMPIKFDQLASGVHVFSNREMMHKNGTIFHVESNVRKLDENQIMAIARDVTERVQVTKENERITYLLNERVKELTTLYRFNQSLQSDHLTEEELLQELVNIMPAGWQYPEITAARILFDKKEFKTSNWGSGIHKQKVSFQTTGGNQITLEVVYLEKRPEAAEGAFLAEERDLINLLAEIFRIFLERKEESTSLARSRAKLQAIFDATDTIYISVDKKFRILSLNKPAREFALRELKSAIVNIGDDITSYHSGEKQSVLSKFLKKALAGEHVNYETSYPHDDGSSSWYDVRILKIEAEGGDVFGLLLAVLDITEKKLMEEKLVGQKVQEQKKISRAIIQAQENERNHIGQELHDNINQILAGTKMSMKAAAKENALIKKIIKYPMDLVDSSIQEIRRLSSKHVTPLKNIRLKGLVGSLLNNWEKNFSVKTKFNYDIGRLSLDDDLKINIYRIIQEQLNNISKYAKAKQVTISILADNKKINVVVADDGVGFNLNRTKKGIGITNMINRVNAFNGDVDINTAPGKGCRVHVRIPLKLPENGLHKNVKR